MSVYGFRVVIVCVNWQDEFVDEYWMNGTKMKRVELEKFIVFAAFSLNNDSLGV